MNATKCISYLTIELKEQIPDGFRGKMSDWIFGCDICQDVCPWNRFAESHNHPELAPKKELFRFDKRRWIELSEQTFQKLFKKTALKRTGYNGLKRNIQYNQK
jgi:epoxyqueuosine reductase